MKRQLPGIVIAALIVWFFPASESLSTSWRQAWSSGRSTIATTVSIDDRIAFGPLRNTASVQATDTLPVSDPFRTEVVPVAVPSTGSRSDLGVPPPPRPWRATGRVGERAAVLTHPDGRVQVVTNGSMVDSSRVISIGSIGIVLEDRAGQFTIKIP